MKIIFEISLLLVVLVIAGSADQIPSCLMPCRMPSEGQKPSLMKQFSGSNDSYTTYIYLNGYEGYFEIEIFPTASDYLVYSANVTVANWLFNSIYRILDEIPIIHTIENNGSTLIVQFPSYMLFHVHLESPVAYSISRISENVGSLQKELINVHHEVNRVTIELENKIKMIHQLKYAISKSTITGDTLICDNPHPLKYPISDNHCSILAGNWMYIDMRRAYTINYIQFRLWDLDLREYFYSLEVSLDKMSWISLAASKTGQSVQTFELEEPLSIRYIRLEGTNNQNSRKLSVFSLNVDWV